MTGGSRRFLIVRLGSLGDVIHAIPVAAALREHEPDARIDWMVDPRYVDVLNLVSAVDSAIPVDPRRNRVALFTTLRDVRQTRYDAAIDLQGLLKSGMLARLAGASKTVGFPRPHLREPLARLFYTHTPDPGDSPHVVHKNLALLEAVGVRERRVRFPLRILETPASESIQAQFGAKGYAIINPGAAWPNKRWPAGRFGLVASVIREQFGMRSVVLWGPGEESLAFAVALASNGAAEVSPPTAIPDLFAIARGGHIMISGDTGPLHIAAAVGTPVVALFGPTFADRNGPWADSDITISRADQCSCHYERRCRRSEPCIDDIAAAEVIAAVEQRLRTHG